MQYCDLPQISTIEAAIGIKFHDWAKQCHAISIAIVKSGIFGKKARVARGWAKGVGSQHSWIALGDIYSLTDTIIDPTLWSYDDEVDGVWVGTLADEIHHPHGEGSIWDAGKPVHQGRETIVFDRTGLSAIATGFLDMVEPLDMGGWSVLLNGAQLGWPSNEIVQAAAKQKAFDCIIKIDILGMRTNLNPGGLYMYQEVVEDVKEEILL